MKEYKRPELEIEEFELEDVLTVSKGDPSKMNQGWY